LVSVSRSRIHQLENEMTEFEKLAEQHEVPREIRRALSNGTPENRDRPERDATA
jgi:uncharacterized protein (UPF0147 family)